MTHFESLTFIFLYENKDKVKSFEKINLDCCCISILRTLSLRNWSKLRLKRMENKYHRDQFLNIHWTFIKTSFNFRLKFELEIFLNNNKQNNYWFQNRICCNHFQTYQMSRWRMSVMDSSQSLEKNVSKNQFKIDWFNLFFLFSF
jgi:hypothetical protein